MVMKSLILVLKQHMPRWILGRMTLATSRPTTPALFLILLVASFGAHAGEPISVSKWSGVTIGGHDTVAYHQPDNIAEHRADEGSKKLSVEWGGAVWRFSNETNRTLFEADPERYRPAYGGHCANALSLGEGLIRTDGATWEIYEDQLYVFYAPRGRTRWNDGNWKNYKVDADQAWQAIVAAQ